VWIRSFHKETGKQKFSQIISILLHFVTFCTNHKRSRNKYLQNTDGCAEGSERKVRPKMQNYAKCLSINGLTWLMVFGERCVDGCSCWSLRGLQDSLRFVGEEGGGRAEEVFLPFEEGNFPAVWGAWHLLSVYLKD